MMNIIFFNIFSKMKKKKKIKHLQKQCYVLVKTYNGKVIHMLY